MSYIIHNGDDKDLPADQSLDLAATGARSGGSPASRGTCCRNPPPTAPTPT